MSESGRRSGRMIKLLCPSLSKQLVLFSEEEEHQRIDLGFISRSLGLDPATLKLNSHFISRGVDLISSLTWKSLLSFFASRGLPTDPLIVHGNLCKSGTKRAHDPSCSENWDNKSSGYDNLNVKRNTLLEDTNILKKKKVDDYNTGTRISSSGKEVDHQTTRYNGISLKRKPTLEDVNLLKKKKTIDGKSGSQPSLPNTISGIQLGNNCIGGSKRPREDAMITTTPSQKS